ncbi:hypothetical protein AMECASPLE_036506 [Ameca splendens]|uniref:Uncharacterized protein n=1 Tax=Ameca splendens TaxID=208324 RepID=A0ABV0YJY4_9TELE
MCTSVNLLVDFEENRLLQRCGCSVSQARRTNQKDQRCEPGTFKDDDKGAARSSSPPPCGVCMCVSNNVKCCYECRFACLKCKYFTFNSEAVEKRVWSFN